MMKKWLTAVEEAINPYASPCVSERTNEIVFNPHDPRVVCDCLSRGWLYRKLRLSGRIEGEVEWDAGGPIERIRVCGKMVASQCPFLYSPHFDFRLESESVTIPAQIDVRLTRILPIALKAIRLVVDNRVVYMEGAW